MASCKPTSFMHRTRAVPIGRPDPATPQPADRLISKSLAPVSNMQTLDDHLSSMRHEGWLLLNEISAADEHSSRHARNHADSAAAAGTVWLRYWFVLDDGHLHWFHFQKDAQKFHSGDEPAFVGSVPLERVVKISMSSQNQDSLAITYQPHAEDEPAIIYNLRGQDRDDRNNWLHSFHCSVAWLVTAMTQRQLRGKSLSDSKGGGDLFRPTGHTHTFAQPDSPAHPRNKSLRPSDGFRLGGPRGGGGGSSGGADNWGCDDELPAAGAGGRNLGASLAPVYSTTRRQQEQQMPWVVKERSVSGASLGSFKEAGAESFLSRSYGSNGSRGSSHAGAAGGRAGGGGGGGGGGSPSGSYGGTSSDEADYNFHRTMLSRQLTIPSAATAQREAQQQRERQAQGQGLHSLDEREAFDLAAELRGLDDDNDHSNHNNNQYSNRNSNHHHHHSHHHDGLSDDGGGDNDDAEDDSDGNDDDDDLLDDMELGVPDDAVGGSRGAAGRHGHGHGHGHSRTQPQPLRRTHALEAALAPAPAPAPAPEPAAAAAPRYLPPSMKRRMEAEAAAAAAAAAANGGAAPLPSVAALAAEKGEAAQTAAAAVAAAAAAAAASPAASSASVWMKGQSKAGGSALSGFCAVQGKRTNMEDRDVVVDDFAAAFNSAAGVGTGAGSGGGGAGAETSAALNPAGQQRHSFYAVFDGHDGVQAADFAAEHICQCVFSFLVLCVLCCAVFLVCPFLISAPAERAGRDAELL
jgi:hypothetical protein